MIGSTEPEIIMSAKEGTARIKINKLLDALGENFQKTTRGYIEGEQALIAASRELIKRFEQKIQAILARVWGEKANKQDCLF